MLVPERYGEDRAEWKGDILELPVSLRSHSYLCLWSLGCEQRDKMADTSDQKVSRAGWLGAYLKIGWDAHLLRILQLRAGGSLQGEESLGVYA